MNTISVNKSQQNIPYQTTFSSDSQEVSQRVNNLLTDAVYKICTHVISYTNSLQISGSLSVEADGISVCQLNFSKCSGDSQTENNKDQVTLPTEEQSIVREIISVDDNNMEENFEERQLENNTQKNGNQQLNEDDAKLGKESHTNGK